MNGLRLVSRARTDFSSAKAIKAFLSDWADDWQGGVIGVDLQDMRRDAQSLSVEPDRSVARTLSLMAFDIAHEMRKYGFTRGSQEFSALGKAVERNWL